MRYLIGLAFCCVLLSSPAHACRGVSEEDTLFFETMPDPQLEADLIAKVSLSEVSRGAAMAELMQVLKVSDSRLHQGERLPLKYRFTSCGPNHRSGAEGVIIGRLGTDSEGRLVLYPYMRRYRDGRITPPPTGDLQFE